MEDIKKYIQKLEEENQNLKNTISTMGSERIYLVQQLDRQEKEILNLKEQIGEKLNFMESYS